MKIAIRLGVVAVAALVTAGVAAEARAWGGHHGGPMGMAGDGPCGERAKPLTATQVKDIIEGRLAWHGEDLKVGAVSDKDGMMVAEVTKPNGELVRRVAVDPKTGRFRRTE